MKQTIGRIAGVPQRRITGGYYTQAEVDQIISFKPKWIAAAVEYENRNAPGSPPIDNRWRPCLNTLE